jgi:hypothetical protein
VGKYKRDEREILERKMGKMRTVFTTAEILSTSAVF